MVQVSAITAFDDEGDREALLLAWDREQHAPVTVEYWKGPSVTGNIPAWARPRA